MKTAEKLLQIAAAEIDYKQKETNSQLDNPGAAEDLETVAIERTIAIH